MTAVQRRRMKRRRRFVRNLKRTIISIMLAPAKMPRVTVQKIDQAMRMSEIAGAIFIAVLMLQLSNPSTLGKVVTFICAAVFVGLLLTVKLGDYQDQLEELKYYGYNI